MSKRQSDRKEDIQSTGQTDRVTERQNDSMADSRAAKEPALVQFRGAHYFVLLDGNQFMFFISLASVVKALLCKQNNNLNTLL